MYYVRRFIGEQLHVPDTLTALAENYRREEWRWSDARNLFERAIALDPANSLARSYYGQLLVQMDEVALAEAQLIQIRAHGGTGTWAERALQTAITTGVTYTF